MERDGHPPNLLPQFQWQQWGGVGDIPGILEKADYFSRISLITACVGFLLGVALAVVRDDLAELLVRTRLYCNSSDDTQSVDDTESNESESSGSDDSEDSASDDSSSEEDSQDDC